MNILERIRDAEAGSMVTISSPCTREGCATAESSFPVEDLRKAIENGDGGGFVVQHRTNGNSLFDRSGKILG